MRKIWAYLTATAVHKGVLDADLRELERDKRLNLV